MEYQQRSISHSGMEIDDNISPIYINKSNQKEDQELEDNRIVNRFQFHVEEVENIYEDHHFTTNREQFHQYDSNAFLQKAQFQRIDKIPNQQAFFLIVIKSKDPDDEEQKIHGYETSYTDLINLLKELQSCYPEHIPNFSEIEQSMKKCIEDRNCLFDILNPIIRQNLLYSSDIFQTFLEVNYKYNLNCQSQNTIYSSTTSMDNSPLGSSQGKIDEDEEGEDEQNNIRKNQNMDKNGNFNFDSPIEDQKKEQKDIQNVSKSSSPTTPNTKIFSSKILSSNQTKSIGSNLKIITNQNALMKKQHQKINQKKSSSGSDEASQFQISRFEDIVNNCTKDQQFKEDSMIKRNQNDQIYQNQIHSNMYLSDHVQEQINNIDEAGFYLPINQTISIPKIQEKDKDLEQGYAEEDGDYDNEEEEKDEEDHQKQNKQNHHNLYNKNKGCYQNQKDDNNNIHNYYNQNVQDRYLNEKINSNVNENQHILEQEYILQESSDNDIYRRVDYKEDQQGIDEDEQNDYDDDDDEDDEEEEEEKTQADEDQIKTSSSKQDENQKKESNINTNIPGLPSMINSQELQEGNYYKCLKRASIRQYTVEDGRFQVTNQYEQNFNQRSSLFQSGSVANYSQFRPHRDSLQGFSQSSFQFLQCDQQSMHSRQLCGSQNSQTMLKRMSPLYQKKNHIKSPNLDDSNQIFINNTNLQNFESSISQSRSKRVIKISKDQIEARCHQQLLQAQTLGSISSTNSFDESPIIKMNRKEKKNQQSLANQNQKGVFSQLSIQYPNHHPNYSQINKQNQIDFRRNSVNIQDPFEELSKNHKSIHRLSILSQNQPNNSLQMVQQASLIKSKNYNTVSEISICGNTVFEADEDSISVKLPSQNICADLNETQNTVTQNNITEELDDSSDSSSANKTCNTKQRLINNRTSKSIVKSNKLQRQFSTHQDLDISNRRKLLQESDSSHYKLYSKQLSKTNPVIDDGQTIEETKMNHIGQQFQDKYMKQIKNQKKNDLTETNDNQQELGLYQDRTELMFKSNNYSGIAVDNQDQDIDKLQNNGIYDIDSNHLNKKEKSSLNRTYSLDSHNSNNMSNAKVVEEYSAQYDFNSNEKVKVEDVNVGLVSGDLKKTDNKEKICNLLLNKQYSDLSEIGSGSYGLVLRARTPDGYIRALKIHCEKTEIEFKLAKLLSSEGTENLSANNIMTYNTIRFRDVASKRKIEVIEMELADDSLKNQIYGVKSEITDEKYRQICTQLIINVLSMHNMCVVHRDLKLDNILVSNGNYLLADFGISEEIGPQLIKKFIPGTDSFAIKQSIAGTQLYFSPIIRDAHSAQPKKYVVEHDPFKSDIYTVGLILLEIELVRQKYSVKQVRQILSDKNLAYEYALQININKYLIKDNYYILNNQLYKPVNILAEMLQIDENNRISSVKLCLICQLDKIILSNIIVPHHKIFPPIIELKHHNTCVIRYTIKLLTYEGSYMKMEDGRILRHGEGSLYKLVEEESVIYKVLVYEGQWDNDLPHGQGTFYFFQNEWVYEGQFRNGQFFGEGVIKFIDWVVYKGTWYNFMLKEFIIPVESSPQDLYLQQENKNVEVVINTHDKEGSMRNVGMNEIELQFEINTFRLYAMNVVEYKPYLKDKQRVRITLMSKKSKHDFNQSARQQLLMVATNKKKKRIFEVFIKYFKHEPILDAIFLEQLIQLLNHPNNPNTSSSKENLLQNSNHNNYFQNRASSPSKYAELISIQDDYNDSESDYENSKIENIEKQKTINNITDQDFDSITYLNFDFFSKECTFQFFQKSQSEEYQNILKVDYLKNIGVPQQIEEESLIKFLLSKNVNNLKELDLSCCKDVSSSIFVALDHKQNSDSLKMLNLKYEAVSQQTFLSLFKYPFLKQILVLDISYSEFDDKCMQELTSCIYFNSLQKLILCYCRNITFKGLDHFIQKISQDTFPQLTYLNFEGILSKGFQNSKNDKKQNQSSSSALQNQNNSTIHQTEQEMLLAFDRKHHLSSSNSNLTMLSPCLAHLQQYGQTNNNGGSTDNINGSRYQQLCQITNMANQAKQNAYYHYFPYTSTDILLQLEFIQKENILRKNLVELNYFTSSFSSSCNLPSLPQVNANDEFDQSSINEQSILSDRNNSINQSKLSINQLSTSNIQNPHSQGVMSLTNIGYQSSSSNTLNNQILNLTTQQPLSTSSTSTNLAQPATGTFLNWVSKLTDKNLQIFEKFSKQNKLNTLQFLSLRATNIDDSFLKNISKNISFKHLKQLDISQCSKITNQGFESIVQSTIFKNLLKLDISQTNISQLAQKKCQQVYLHSLNLVDCSNLTFNTIFNYFSSKENSSAIRQLYLDSDKFFLTQVNQVLLECQRLEEIHIFITPQKTDLQPNQLTLNLILEKGCNLNFYSSKLFIESVNELIKTEIIQSTQVKIEQFHQIFINGIPYIELNRFSTKSGGPNQFELIKIDKTQILDIPSKDISLEQLNDENIIEDLRKLFNSRNFLLVKELDISRLKVNSYAGQLLAGSRYTRSLAYIDISYSTITDEDLDKLSKSKYLPKLQLIKLNCCKDITEKGINYLLNAQNNLENLKTIEVKQRLLNLYLLYPQCSERVQIIADSILFKAEQNYLKQLNPHKLFLFTKYWTKIFRDNMQNINSIQISGFDENIIDYFLTHITDKNRVKKVIIDFSKKNQKNQSQQQNLLQFQRINQIFSKLPDLKELRLDFSRWRDMTDLSVKEFSEGIISLKNLKILELNLYEWGKNNNQITDLSCWSLGKIFEKILKINVISIDLSNWGEENLKITDKSIQYLCEGIHYTKDHLTYLSLNLNSWGSSMTNNSLILLHYLVRDLNLLSFLNLGLQEWGKDNPNINDQGIESLTTAIGNSKYLNQLEINLAYAAHLNSGIGDGSVQNLAKSLMNINSLSSLKINLGWWMVDMNLYGFNTDVSHECIKDLASAIGKLKSLTELDLNFDRWGYKNKFIKDESIINLADNIENLHALNYLSLNFDWWGLGNEKITEKSLIQLGNKVTQLNKLTQLQLCLSLDRWKKIEEKHIISFKEKIMTLKNFNKNIIIDIK